MSSDRSLVHLHRRTVVLAAAVCAALAASSRAADYSYSTDASANWSTIVPGGGAAGDTLDISANLTANRTITMDVPGTIASLQLRDTVLSNYWLIGGSSTLTFDNTATTDAVLTLVNSGSSNYMRIGAPIQLNDNLVVNTSFDAASGDSHGRFDFDGNVVGGGKTLTINGVYDFTFDQATRTISDLGGFTWNSSGSASFASGLSVGGSSGLAVNQGIVGGAVTMSGPINPGGALTVDARGYSPVTLAGQISGATDLVITGAGLQPKYVLSSNTEGNPASRNIVWFSNSLANSFSGNVSVTGAALNLDFSNGMVSKVGSGSLTLNAAMVEVDDHGSTVTTQSFSSTTIGAGESDIVVKRDNVNTTLSLGAITRNTGGTAIFRYGGGTIGTNTFITTTNTATNGILGGWALLATNGTAADDFAGVGTGGLITAPGTNGAAAYTTLTTSITGTGAENMNYNSGSALATRTASLNANSLRFQNATSADQTVNWSTYGVTLASGGLLVTNTGASSIVNTTFTGTGTISAADANSDLFVYVRNNRLTIDNPLIGSGTGALYKGGYGKLTVTNDAAYTGGTWVSGGVFDIGGVSSRLSSGNLRLYNGGQLGSNGTFDRAIGTGANQVSFGTGGGGFSAEGGDLSVNLGGAGATLTKSDISGNISLNNAFSSSGIITLVNPVDTTGGVAISVGANASPGMGKNQSNGGVAYARLQGGTTGSGDLEIFGGAANPGNPNNPHGPSGLLFTTGNLGHTGNTVVNGTTLYVPPSFLDTMNNIALTSGAQLATNGVRTIRLGGGPGEVQVLGQTFVNDGGFAAIGGDLTVTLNDGDTSISPGNGYAPSDFAMGSAFSGYTTKLTNTFTGSAYINPTGPGVVVYSGSMSGTGAISSGGNNPTSGVLLVSGDSNTFTGNTGTGDGVIYRAGHASALGAAGGDNGTGGTYDLNGYDFSTESFNGGGNGNGTFSMGRIINSNTTSAASFNNFRVTDMYGGGNYVGGDGTLSFNNLTSSSALAQGGAFRWLGTGTLNYNGNSSGVTYAGSNQQFRMGFQGGTVNLNYAGGATSKLFQAIVGAPTNTSVSLSLNSVSLNLNGNASTAVTETTVDNGATGSSGVYGVSIDGFNNVKLTTAGANVTFNMNRISVNNRGAINFATDTTAGGAAAVTTDTLNNTAGVMGAWATWNKTDWAANSTNAADGAIAALSSYTTDNNVGGWTTGATTLNRDIDNATSGTLAANTRIGSLRFNNGSNATTLDLGTFGLSLGAAAETGGILVTPGTSANVTITGGAINPGGSNLGTGDSNGNTNLYIHQNGTGLLEIASKITGSSNVSVVKTGSGTLRLSGASTYTASTTIFQGVLEATTIAPTSTNQSTGKGADIQIFNGSTLRLLNAADATTNKRIQVGLGGGTLDLASSGTTVTFSGQNTQIGNSNVAAAVYRTNDAETPDFTVTGAGNATFDGGIFLSTPANLTTDYTRNLADQVTMAKFIMNGSGTVTVNNRLIAQGGTIVNSGTLVLGNATDTLSNNAALTVNTGGTVNIAAGKSDNLGQFYLKGGTITGTGTLKTLANFVESGTINANLGGELAGLDKTTSGTVTLTGANTYAGDTRVSAGTLIVNNSSGSGTGTGRVIVSSGATLGGSGAISGPVSILAGATLAPGNSPGILSTGSVDMAGTLSMELNGLVAGSGHDQLAVTGTVNVSGADLQLSAGYALNGTESFTLIDNDGTDAITGTGFATVNGTALGVGNTFTLGGNQYQLAYNGGTGNDMVISPVPEPSLAILGAATVVCSLGLRRRSAIEGEQRSAKRLLATTI